MSKYNLSNAEYELMEFFWENNQEFSLAEIMDYCSNTLRRGWKKQTIHTFLRRLIDKGALQAVRRGVRYYYSPTMSKEDFVSKWTREFLEKEFNGSLKHFIVSLTGGTQISKEECQELQELLDSLFS